MILPAPDALSWRYFKETGMEALSIVTIQPLVALLFGILILLIPRLLNYLIAIYLILVGAMGLWPHLFAGATTT
jgi:hypothetical protein